MIHYKTCTRYKGRWRRRSKSRNVVRHMEKERKMSHVHPAVSFTALNAKELDDPFEGRHYHTGFLMTKVQPCAVYRKVMYHTNNNREKTTVVLLIS